MDKKKLKERGYNQAFLLARALAQHTNLSLEDILLKEKGYADQIGLSKEERLRNLKGAFKTKKDKVQAAKGKRIILVDDVFTTGATAKECSDILMRAGAKEVGVLVVAVSLSSL
jgi:competence protein ComFC